MRNFQSGSTNAEWGRTISAATPSGFLLYSCYGADGWKSVTLA